MTGDIDFADTLDHRQLFAQLRHEVLEGVRYWLDDDETQVLIGENERFQRVNGLEEMIAATFRKPDDAEAGRWMTVTEIMELLRSRYGNADVRNASLTQIGYVLNYPRFGFKSRRKAHGMTYLLVER